ncbi:hypothetical protein CBF23_009190 [Marinomonas agarivorans]|nr:hypothetical protein CBF23_009190 [Marinomonas agarivorans]
MTATLVSMMLFAFTGAVSPGPVNIIAASAGANFGFYKALPHVLGATVAYTLVVLIAGSLLNQMAIYMPNIAALLRYVGAVFLLYMSYKIATAFSEVQDDSHSQSTPNFLHGAVPSTR